MNRPELTAENVNAAVLDLQLHLRDVENRKGPRAFVSSHEALGVLEDERSELVHEIQSKAGANAIRHELLDIAVAALWSVASMDAGAMDW